VALAVMLLVAVGLGVLIVDRQTSLGSLANAAVRRVASRVGGTAPAQSPPPAQVSLQVETRRTLRAISPLIYGISVAGAGQLVATGAHLNRWGGDPNTRYNWALGSAWNAARDWEFRNYGGPPGAPSASADAFVDLNRSLGVQSVITIPAIGWVARNGDTETQSVDVPGAGGPPLAGQPDAIAGYDPGANRAVTSVRSVARKGVPFVDPPDPSAAQVSQDEWVNHLVRRYGRADAGGVGSYVIDNEPDLWSETHTDVHPVEPGYDDMLASFVEYATAIKDVDSTAQVLGPALSGWTAYLYSARDRGTDNFRTHADRLAHGDMAFLPWWLDQVRQHDEFVGRRTLDALDVHYYPQALGVYSSADDPATQALRLRSTRALWDPCYVDESWIAEPVRLIPRLREWIDQYYPGTRLAINEWNWGADQTLNGALAIADVLGIFGREGVDMAAYWVAPASGSAGAFAFAMYTNYDGHGHGFGDQALLATSDHPDDVAVYASRDSKTGDLLILAVNQRSDADLPITLNLDEPAVSGVADVYAYSAQRPDAIETREPLAVNAGALSTRLPAASITLLRLAH
jgi:Glycoside hydrolase family 44